VSGNGLALAGVSVEQDAAYWEAHIDIPGEGDPIDVMFGVATKKDRKYYKVLEEQEEGTSNQRFICHRYHGCRASSNLHVVLF
jgi:hypothetical protein